MTSISGWVMGTPLNGQRETELHIIDSARPRPLFQHCGGTGQEQQVQGGGNGCMDRLLAGVQLGDYGNLHGVQEGRTAREKIRSHVMNLMSLV